VWNKTGTNLAYIRYMPNQGTANEPRSIKPVLLKSDMVIATPPIK